MHYRRPRNQGIAPGGPQVVDLELGGHDRSPEDATGREGERIVGSVADNSSVDETMLLLQLGANGNPDFRATLRKNPKLGTQEGVEGL